MWCGLSQMEIPNEGQMFVTEVVCFPPDGRCRFSYVLGKRGGVGCLAGCNVETHH